MPRSTTIGAFGPGVGATPVYAPRAAGTPLYICAGADGAAAWTGATFAGVSRAGGMATNMPPLAGVSAGGTATRRGATAGLDAPCGAATEGAGAATTGAATDGGGATLMSARFRH